MPNKRERKALKTANKEQIEDKKAAKAEYRRDIAEWKSQQGGLTLGHHCPHKEQAKTHALNEKRCIEKLHVGYCPACFNLVSYLYGCSVHRCKKEELLGRRPKNFEKLKEQNAAKGYLGPRAFDARAASEYDAAGEEGQDVEGEVDFIGLAAMDFLEGASDDTAQPLPVPPTTGRTPKPGKTGLGSKRR